MAIGTPVSLGTSAGVATTILTTTAAVAAGESILVHAWVANTRTFTSVTDSVGNTYTQNQTVGTNPHMALWSCHNAIALPSGSTITANLNSSTISARGIDAMKVSGLATTSTLDQHTSATGSTAAWSVGPTGTLAQADELAVYAVADNAAATANTPDGSWVDINDFATSGTADGRMAMGYRIVSATTALTASGTMGAEAWTAIIATYKAATGSIKSGSGTLSAAASVIGQAGNTRPGAGVTSASSLLAGAMAATRTGKGVVNAVASLSGRSSTTVAGKGTVNAASSLAGSASVTRTGVGAASSQASLAGAGSSVSTGGGSLSSESSLSGVGARTQTSGGSLSSSSDLTGLAVVEITGAGVSSGTSTLAGHGGLLPEGAGILDSSSSLQGAGVVFVLSVGSGSLEGSSSMSGAATRTVGGYGSLASVTTLEGACVISYVGAGELSSTTIMAGAGASLLLPGPAATGRMDDSRGHIATTRPGRVSDSPRGSIT